MNGTQVPVKDSNNNQSISVIFFLQWNHLNPELDEKMDASFNTLTMNLGVC